mgnify:CR=1 FL=1
MLLLGMVLEQSRAAKQARLYSATSLVADLDNTLVEGNVAEGMGKYFLKDELRRLHLPHVWLGMTNYSKVKQRAEAEAASAQ